MQLHYVHRKPDHSLAHTTHACMQQGNAQTAQAPPSRAPHAAHTLDSQQDRLQRAYEHARGEAKRWKTVSEEHKAELALVSAENATYRASVPRTDAVMPPVQVALEQAAEYRLELVKLKDRFRALKAQHDDVLVELESARAQGAPNNANDNPVEALSLQQSLKKSQSELAVSQQRLEKSQCALDSADRRLLHVQEKLASVRAARVEDQTRIAALEGKLDKAKARLHSLSELQAELDRACLQLKSMQSEAKRLEATRAELAEARSQIKSLEPEAKRLEAARTELAAARAAYKRLESDQAVARSEIKDLSLAKAQLETIQKRARDNFQRSQSTVAECASMMHTVDEVLKLCACLHDKSDMGTALQQSRERISEFLKGISAPACQ